MQASTIPYTRSTMPTLQQFIAYAFARLAGKHMDPMESHAACLRPGSQRSSMAPLQQRSCNARCPGPLLAIKAEECCSIRPRQVKNPFACNGHPAAWKLMFMTCMMLAMLQHHVMQSFMLCSLVKQGFICCCAEHPAEARALWKGVVPRCRACSRISSPASIVAAARMQG